MLMAHGDLLAKQLNSALNANAVFCMACGQPDEPELHDPAKCPATPGSLSVAGCLEVYDRSQDLMPELDDEARALHCAALGFERRDHAGPTEDAYLRACRALHWAQGQLRAHGIEPDAIAPDAPHYPPDDHVFQSVADRSGGEAALAIGEHAFRAGWRDGWQEGSEKANRTADKAWSDYDPPEHIKALT